MIVKKTNKSKNKIKEYICDIVTMPTFIVIALFIIYSSILILVCTLIYFVNLRRLFAKAKRIMNTIKIYTYIKMNKWF
jgi:hypothetical protein